MRIVFEFEDSEIKKNQRFFDELYKLIKNAPVSPESGKEPKEKKELPEVITKDTPMLDLGLSSAWRDKIRSYGEKHYGDKTMRLGQFVGLKNYNSFSGGYLGGYLACDDTKMVFILKNVLKKLWTPGMEIPVSALKFSDLRRQTILKNTIGGDVFKDPDFDWSVCYKPYPNQHPIYFLCALIDYIFNPTDEAVSLEERRKVGKDEPEKIDGNMEYEPLRKKFAEIAEVTDYHLEMPIEDALSGLSEQLMYGITGFMEHCDCQARNFGEFTDTLEFGNDIYEYVNSEMLVELVLKLESIIKKIWTDDIGALTIKNMKFEGRYKKNFNMYGIEDFRSPKDLHDMFVGTSCALSMTRFNALLRVIYNLMIKK